MPVPGKACIRRVIPGSTNLLLYNHPSTSLTDDAISIFLEPWRWKDMQPLGTLLRERFEVRSEVSLFALVAELFSVIFRGRLILR